MEVKWSPFAENNFLLTGCELALYEVESVNSGFKNAGVKLSEEAQAHVVTTFGDLPNGKHLSWAPKSLENILALVSSNGHILITNIGKVSAAEGVQLVGKELIPRHSRLCTGLDWNQVETNLIAQSLDKHRADSAILIWDVKHKNFWDAEYKNSKGLAEVALGESASCVCWFKSSPKSFISGVNNKLLRIYDLRDTSRPRTIAYSKGVSEVRVDPMNDNRVASCSETEICIWDTRSFDKPVVKLFEGNNINHLHWSPTRPNLLGCVVNDRAYVRLFDLQTKEYDDSETCYTDLFIRPFAKNSEHSVSSFDWHPTKENQILVANTHGELSLCKVFEKIHLSWSSGTDLAVGSGHDLIQCDTAGAGSELSNDICSITKSRALNGYGIQKNVLKNAELVDDPTLVKMWSWLHSRQSQSDGQKPFIGLTTLFPLERSRESPTVAFASEEKQLNWQITDGHNLSNTRLVYHSQERSEALCVCGWGSDLSTPSTPLLDKLIEDRHYPQAVALAVFTLRLGLAIQTLNVAAQFSKSSGSETEQGTDYNLVAMAVAGFSDNMQTLWKDMCQSLASKIDDSYIRAVFTFLTSEDNDISNILNDQNIDLSDRLALACLYLPDTRLATFINEQTQKTVAAGDLNGLLLTGLGTDALELLQNYLDRTSDIQTVAALIIQTFPTQLSLRKDAQATAWVDSYREILDNCALWLQRCDFDVFCGQLESFNRVYSNVYLCCNFCGKTVGYNSLQRRRGFILGAAGVSAAKITSCPECRRPLPRCAVCLLNMGTASIHPLPGSGLASDGPGQSPYITQIKNRANSSNVKCKVAPLCDWFSWCQSCRHGGHLEHLNQWFSEQTECPVTGCICQCNVKDIIQPVRNKEEV